MLQKLLIRNYYLNLLKINLFNIIYTDFVNIYLKIASKNKKVSICAVLRDEQRERASGCQLARCVGLETPWAKSFCPYRQGVLLLGTGSCARKAPFPIPSPISA